jgi:hypothetical protein
MTGAGAKAAVQAVLGAAPFTTFHAPLDPSVEVSFLRVTVGQNWPVTYDALARLAVALGTTAINIRGGGGEPYSEITGDPTPHEVMLEIRWP